MTARQPGIAFVSPATSIAEALPRMDIACFVGFAARGPVHEPVAVESAEHYGRVFGGDLPDLRDVRDLVASQGRVGREGQIVLTGVVQQGVLAEQYVILDLNGGQRSTQFLDDSAQQRQRKIRHADIARQALFLERHQGLDRARQVPVGARPMDHEQVDVIAAQGLEGFLLADAKTVLFVDDHEAEALEGDVFL